MSGEVSPEQAKRIIDMLTEGGAIKNVNAPLALRLIPLAEELKILNLLNDYYSMQKTQLLTI